MKEFDFELKNIFGGLDPERSNRKANDGLSECHNLEPLKNDYDLHEAIIDMNATGQNWQNENIDYWHDDQDDDWQDDQDDNWEDI